MNSIRRALISVSDKTGLVDFARFLINREVEIISTGGTASALRDAGIPVRDVSTVTGFPEIMDGRIKTLHPRIYGGLLCLRDNALHRRAAHAHGILEIDLVVVNLYPFEDALARGEGHEMLIERIDIGGPSMLRAGAKNAQSVVVVTDIADYACVMEEMDMHGGTVSESVRRRLGSRAFARTASYDAAIAGWMAARHNGGDTDKPDLLSADLLTIRGESHDALRYGENPHQRGRFYRFSEQRPGVGNADMIQGKPLSYNNIQDADSAFECASSFDDAACAGVCIVKHSTPCGVGLGESVSEAYDRAFRCDRFSAFGGIVGVNRCIDGAGARLITRIFTELVIAPDADEQARAVFAKTPALRVLLTGRCPRIGEGGIVFRSVCGGFLAQTRDEVCVHRDMLRTVTRRAPSRQEVEDLLFAFTVCRYVQSNAIVFARSGMTVGIGGGQTSRLDAVHIAVRKGAEAARLEAEERGGDPERITSLCIGAVAASDAFFPFPDALEAITAAGATAVIQPGGSRNDADVIAAADKAGIAMVFTGMRHFRH